MDTIFLRHHHPRSDKLLGVSCGQCSPWLGGGGPARRLCTPDTRLPLLTYWGTESHSVSAGTEASRGAGDLLQSGRILSVGALGADDVLVRGAAGPGACPPQSVSHVME